MSNVSKVITSLFLLLTAIIPVWSQQKAQPIDCRILYQSEIIKINGIPTIYYELVLSNRSAKRISLKGLKVLQAKDSDALLILNSNELIKRSDLPEVPSPANSMVLASGSSCLLYMELNLKQSTEALQIFHQLEFEYMDAPRIEISYSLPSFIVSEGNTVTVLGSPFTDGNWAAVYDPAWKRGHRRVIYSNQGKRYIPGRFAIDFVRLDDKGQYFKGNEDSIKNWFGYGNDILAVADGIVSSVKEDATESATLSVYIDPAAEQAAGNYISIRVGRDRFAFYEHLKPGSIKVKPGQRVKKGEVIAALGFTGQSTGPHLHFHMANKDTPLYAEGIPFVFESFMTLGSYPDFETFGKAIWERSGDTIRNQAERPLPNSVINFDKL
jgi:murein DD-endopeptidase